MNRIRKILKSFSGKVIFIFCMVMVICCTIWTVVMFLNIRSNAIQSMLDDEEIYIEQTIQNVNGVKEVCNMTFQIVSQMDSICDYMELVQMGGELSKEDKIDFYNNDIASINNITNVNPYLYHIRLFVNAENITEQKPCIYNISRIENMSWGQERRDGVWYMDYTDTVFPNSTGASHLAGLTSTIYNSNGEELCIVEVATKMSLLFPDIYLSNDNEWACYLDAREDVFSSDSYNVDENVLGEIKKQIYSSVNDSSVFNITVSGVSYVVSFNYISSLNGTYIHAVKVDSFVSSYFSNQKIYIFAVAITFILSVIIVAYLLTVIFRRFNMMTYYINKIKKGQTDVRLETDGDDEIAILSEQINQMLDRLEMLNKLNTDRQLLVKNTEIKSMQNQINAHFMYNVLESIKMMAEIDGEYRISDAVTSLGQMFRYSVKWTSGKANLQEEIDYVKNYISLMNLRLEDEVNLSINVPDELINASLPKMSLQPIVENSILHGIEGVGHSSTIYLKAFIENNDLIIEISDNGQGMSKEQLNEVVDKLNGDIERDEAETHGIALKNVQDRIKMYYGEEYGLNIFSKKELYTKVLIKLPYKKEK